MSHDELVLLRPLLDPFSLLAVTFVTSFCVDYCNYHSFFLLERVLIACPLLSVVASIEEFAERYSVPKSFIGMILLPIVVSEYQTLFSCQVKIAFQSRQMQLNMSLPYGWL